VLLCPGTSQISLASSSPPLGERLSTDFPSALGMLNMVGRTNQPGSQPPCSPPTRYRLIGAPFPPPFRTRPATFLFLAFQQCNASAYIILVVISDLSLVPCVRGDLRAVALRCALYFCISCGQALAECQRFISIPPITYSGAEHPAYLSLATRS
jgi:hypothetical protein